MCENAAPAGKPSGLGGNRPAGLGGVGKATAVGGVQTRRGLRDITNKVDETSVQAEAKRKKRETSASDTNPAATKVPVTSDATVASTDTDKTTTVKVPLKPLPAAVVPVVNSRQTRPPARVPTDIDIRDADEPLAVTEYVEDLYAFLREREVATKVDRRYMEKQPNVNERMRSILIDWLVEVHLKFKLVPDTLYLTVYLIDKYLELEKVGVRFRLDFR